MHPRHTVDTNEFTGTSTHPWCKSVFLSDIRQPGAYCVHEYSIHMYIWLYITGWIMGEQCTIEPAVKLQLSIKTVSPHPHPPRWICKSPFLEAPHFIILVTLWAWPTSPFCSFFNKLVLPWVRPQILLCVLTKNRGSYGKVLFETTHLVTVSGSQ